MMIRLAFCGWLAVFLVLPVRAEKESAPLDWDARITAVKGEVTLFPKDGDSDGILVSKDLPLLSGDRIKTSPNSNVTFYLDGKHAVYLRAGTELTLSSFRKAGTEFSLVRGSVLGNFSKLKPMGAKITIKSPAADVEVLWGALTIEVSSEGAPRTIVGVRTVRPSAAAY